VTGASKAGTGDEMDDASAEPGVWRFARADKVRVVVDAEAYFDLMQQAMLKARRRILLIGWDFDTRIHLTRGRRWWQRAWNRQFPSRLGAFFPWLTRNTRPLEILILKWGIGALKFLGRGTMAFDLLRWAPHPRIDFKFDTAHPVGCSHHQKIVVIDQRLAVCGGIDMTDGRWDTREHLEKDARRKRPLGSLYGPWHDLTMLMEGPVAEALDELGRDRWRRAGGKPLPPIAPADASPWPDGLDAHFENVEIGIARTRAEYNDDPGVKEIEELFVSQIAAAKRFIYAESQYFASRAIAEAMAARMAEPDPPEIVIVHPNSADGWIESTAMDPARARLVQAIQAVDHKRRFHLYMPYTGETPIYVHAKLMIVDDEILRVGSANFNNRSMGLDSECDVFIDCARPGNAHACNGIRALRLSLLAEHCGLAEDEIAAKLESEGSMAALIDLLDAGSGRHLRRYEPEEVSDIEAELADRQVLDPEEPAQMFCLRPPRRGLFRSGSLLARAMDRVKRKRRR
jgi:phosphatidylserine/phosphatidylglycerophosphate/cardiolipin synthase-like enzyme